MSEPNRSPESPVDAPSPERPVAVIVGAGPAGLTAAYELATRTDIRPVVLEMDDLVGGISRTVEYRGNRIDIGGHRFFSKSDRVMNWWLDKLPLEKRARDRQTITYQRKSREIEGAGEGPDPDTEDRVMLLRERRSRIYFTRKFFDYPISLSPDTLRKLGLWRTFKIGLSYLKSSVFKREENNLEDFFVNRFGRELYGTFFESYTEKVWGVPCREISAEWGAQRIKGLSVARAVLHFLKKLLPSRGGGDIGQKGTETSLIEQFLYPKLGPGQMWQEVARRVEELGGSVEHGWRVDRILTEATGDGDRRQRKVTGVEAVSVATGERRTVAGQHVFSTMPVNHLIDALDAPVPEPVREVAHGLQFRDFVTVGLLLDRLEVTAKDGSPIRDNWIYIQEPDVLVGRMQIFNNWSPYMVADPDKVWVGLEYFCYDTDPLWNSTDEELIALGAEEMEKIGLARRDDVRDGVVIRVPKTYPAYFGTYERFDEIRDFVSGFEGLYLVGRNGMHRYNNQDHSMLAAMTVVDNLVAGRSDMSNVWEVNTEQEYHEEKDDDASS